MGIEPRNYVDGSFLEKSKERLVTKIEHNGNKKLNDPNRFEAQRNR